MYVQTTAFTLVRSVCRLYLHVPLAVLPAASFSFARFFPLPCNPPLHTSTFFFFLALVTQATKWPETRHRKRTNHVRWLADWRDKKYAQGLNVSVKILSPFSLCFATHFHAFHSRRARDFSFERTTFCRRRCAADAVPSLRRVFCQPTYSLPWNAFETFPMNRIPWIDNNPILNGHWSHGILRFPAHCLTPRSLCCSDSHSEFVEIS